MSLETLSQEDIELLSVKSRNRELVEGVVRRVTTMKLPIEDDQGKVESQETEVAVFYLENGVQGYCPKAYFREHDFATLNGFVGTKHDVVIHQLDLEHKVAIVSVLEADRQKANNFVNEIKMLEQEGQLQSKHYTGVIQNINPKTQTVHVRVEGHDCFMKANEWSWNRRNDITVEADRGLTLDVAVKRFTEDENGRTLVEVSRRLTQPDPFQRLQEMRQNDQVMGKVSRVDPVHGIFVAVEGVELKGSKPSYLPDPELGEIVNCRVRDVNPEQRVGKVIIVDYPRGKKQRRDITDFIFE